MTLDDFLAKAPVHPDSLADYRIWETLLRRWNPKINLVAPGTLDDFWSRHALDSAQILPHIPTNARTIVDFGSGAGFPGLSLAIAAKHDVALGWEVHLIESSGKKCSFLKSVSRETQAACRVHNERIEAVTPLTAQVVTARAFAPLNRILPLAERHMDNQNRSLVLLKGESWEDELADIAQSWSFDHKTVQSLTDPSGVILTISDFRRK